MWKLAVVAAVAVGCSKPGRDAPKPDPAIAAAALDRVPRIDTADVLAVDDGLRPPVVILIDDAGAIQIAAAASWREVTSRDLRIGARPVTLEVVGPVLRESHELRRTPKQIVDAIVAAPATLPPKADDPPPPVESTDDDRDDDYHQYRMSRRREPAGRNADEREVQRQVEARVQQREAVSVRTGTRGPREIKASPNDEATRLATVVGEVSNDGRFADEPPALILATPRAKASALIRTLTETEGLIAVAHNGAIRPLRLSFGFATGGRQPGWIEARISTGGIALEAVPAVPVIVTLQGAAIDRTALDAALDATRKVRKLDRLAPIDVLVEPDVDVQRLVDVLVALDLVGARMIGLGEAPVAGSPAAAQRGRRIPRVRQGWLNAQGDLDKAVIRAHIVAKQPEVRACYEAALVTKPDLEGTLMVQFFIMPTGLVASISASGVDPAVGECVSKALKTTVFPHPKGGGGVQVNLPFSLRP